MTQKMSLLSAILVACSGARAIPNPGPDAEPVPDAASDVSEDDSVADHSSDTSDAEADSPAVTDGSIADADLAEACVAAGGSVSSEGCCLTTHDFPSDCVIGACGCSPSSSHAVAVCVCASGYCWNGGTCIPRG